MKKVLLLPLAASMALLSSGELPAGPLIPVKTRSTALVFSTDATNHLTQYYLGLASAAPATYDPASDNGNVVYPAAGGVFHSQPALRATHFDGNTSTDLVYVQHGTQDLGSGVTLTTIKLKDSYYPFFVELCIRSYGPDDVFEEWAQVHHQEPGAVTLFEVASAALVVNFVVSLGGDAQPSEGAALGGALLAAGDFVNSFEYEEPDSIFPYRRVPATTRLRILGGTIRMKCS